MRSAMLRNNFRCCKDFCKKRRRNRSPTHMNPLLSTPIQLTQLQKDAATLLSFPAVQLQQRLDAWKNAFRLIWKNSDSTPSEVVAALGTNAANLFQLSSL